MKLLFTILAIVAATALYAQGFDKFDHLAQLQEYPQSDTSASNVQIGRFGIKAVFPNLEVWMSWEDHLVGLTTYEPDGTAFLQINAAEISQPSRLRYLAQVDAGVWIELDARLGRVYIHQQCQTLAFDNRWP